MVTDVLRHVQQPPIALVGHGSDNSSLGAMMNTPARLLLCHMKVAPVKIKVFIKRLSDLFRDGLQ